MGAFDIGPEGGGTGALRVRAEALGFRYADADRPALEDIDVDLPAGRVLLIVGPSGSGKSTLARAIAGLLPAEFPGEWRGSLRVGEIDVGRASRADASARVGIVFQDPGSQLVMERAGDDVAFGLENRAWPLPAMRRRVPVALGEVGLAGFEDRRSTRLSGGEQQRLALAGVLAAAPGVLVLDEPTANLDRAGTEGLYRHLASLLNADERHARGGAGGDGSPGDGPPGDGPPGDGPPATTIVLVEHRVEEAWPLADLVLALDDAGHVIDVGTPTVVLARSGDRLDAAGIWRPENPGVEALTATSPAASASPVPLAEPGGPAEPRGRAELDVAPSAEPGREPVLEVSEAWFDYEPGSPVLHGVSLSVGRGERVVLRGPNGSGKSTLLRLAMGLQRPRAGEVRLLGDEPSRLPPARLAERVGYVVQDPELGFVADTVREEIELGLPSAARAWVAELAARLDLPLERFADRNPYRLSGGEQRRLSIVTALARRPSLLVLDEPTFGQDRRGHQALVATLDELAAAGTAILAATHDDRFVAAWADRTVDLEEGWVVGTERMPGPPARRSRFGPGRGRASRGTARRETAG